MGRQGGRRKGLKDGKKSRTGGRRSKKVGAGRRSGRRSGRQGAAVNQLYGAPSDPLVDEYGAPGNEVDTNPSCLPHLHLLVSRLVLQTRRATGQGLPPRMSPSTREAGQSLATPTMPIGVGRAVRESLCKRWKNKNGFWLHLMKIQMVVGLLRCDAFCLTCNSCGKQYSFDIVAGLWLGWQDIS